MGWQKHALHCSRRWAVYILTEGKEGEMAEQKSVVVTGASTGIGYGIARVLGQRGIHVFGGVRKQGDADRLARELGATFTPLLMDVTDEAGVHAAAEMAARQLGSRTLFGLVNNAGIGSAGGESAGSVHR
jgi:NAD(P)-dependent dehydrogenase (short-subunit alcohol dehydrogenase family)